MILEQINSCNDIKKLNFNELNVLEKELREEVRKEEER